MHEKTMRFSPLTKEELETYWVLRDKYMREDVIPNAVPPITDEEVTWFFSDDYRKIITTAFWREQDRLDIAYLFLEEEYVGFITYILYDDKDGQYFGECFILDYCVEANLRNRGLGSSFARRFIQDMKQQGAVYFALNTSNERNRAFWTSLGFVHEKEDDHGEPVYVKR